MSTENDDKKPDVSNRDYYSPESVSDLKGGSKGTKWGYDLYPERRGGSYKPTIVNTLIADHGRFPMYQMKCERNVYRVYKQSPIVRLLAAALKSSGCEFDIRRHVSCEVCDFSVSGGYDPELNQIVICHNVARGMSNIQGVMAHEMIHMFDYCRNDLNFKNIDHLACTEVRAANLTHCSYTSAWLNGDVSSFNIKQSHQQCVKNKAVLSVLAVRKVSEEEARAAVERVFTRCYNDLEPIGRRIKRNSIDMHKAYLEAPMYGYDYIN